MPSTKHLLLALPLALGSAACSTPPERLDVANVLAEREERRAEVADAGPFDREALLLACARSDARVRRSIVGLERARRGAEVAGRLPDPTLSLDVLYLDFDADDPWLIGGALEFALPFLSTRDAERAAAEAGVRRAAAEVADAARSARLDAALLWIDAWSAERRRASFDTASAELNVLAASAERMASAGELGPLDARRLGMAATRLRLDALESATALERVALDVAARLDLATLPTFALPTELDAALEPAPDDARLDPRVAIALADLAIAEERMAAAARGAYDGATLGPSGEWEDGEARYGLTFSLPLPITGRVAALRAVAEIGRREAVLELELAVAAVEAERRGAMRELLAARRESEAIEAQWLPLAEEQCRVARALFEAGEATAVDIEGALNGRLDARLAHLDALTRAARSVARLDAVGSTDTDAPLNDER